MIIETIDLKGEELKGLPLFFRKIYFNQVTDINVEMTLMDYNAKLQCQYMRSALPERVRISKTLNNQILKKND